MIRLDDLIFEGDVGTIFRPTFYDKHESSGNDKGAGTVLVQKEISSDTPSTGTLKIYNVSTKLYDSYAYTSFSGKTFTLSATLSRDYKAGRIVKVPVDISSATTKQLHVKYSDKTTKSLSLSFVGDGTDGETSYTTVSGDLSPSGTTRAQGYVVTSNGEWRSEQIEFTIQPKLV